MLIVTCIFYPIVYPVLLWRTDKTAATMSGSVQSTVYSVSSKHY